MSTGGPSDSANGEAQDTRKWYEGPERFKVNAHEMWKREALQHAGVFERAGDDHRAARRHAAAAEAYDTAMRYHHEFHGVLLTTCCVYVTKSRTSMRLLENRATYFWPNAWQHVFKMH